MSALEALFLRRCAIQIHIYIYVGWQVDEEVNQDETGEADGMNLEVDSKVS